MWPNLIDLTGKRFGRWVVLERVANDKHRNLMWLCECDCGNKAAVQGNGLKNNHSRSCGCLKRDLLKQKRLNENHPLWMGDNAGYTAIHEWLAKNKPKPSFCEMCRERPPVELSYNYKNAEWTRDPEDYQWLCTSCHRLKDIGRGARPLTRTRVHRLREFYRVGAATQKELATLFKVDPRTIHDIVRRKQIYSTT